MRSSNTRTGAVGAPRPVAGAVVARGHASTTGTVAALNPESQTAKGRGIREDMERLNEDHFGSPDAVPEAEGSAVQQRLVAAVTPSPSTMRFARPPPTVSAELSPSWMQGPASPEGMVFDASDRNLLCMDVQGGLCVVGSADHGLTVFDLARGRKVRTLYNKTNGHSEWVTTCCFLRDGRVLSGGMDSKLCLWHKSAARCDDLMGHTGSIAQVQVNDNNVAVSAAYDRTVRVWDCDARACLMTLSGHAQPVSQFQWVHTTLFSGDRKGQVIVWDLATSKAVVKLSTKGGQIGSLGALIDSEHHLVMAGDQSGTVSIWDFCLNGPYPVFQQCLHPGGVVSALTGTTMASDNLIVTAGADRRILTLDPRGDFAVIHTFAHHRDFIYSLITHGPLILSGSGDGALIVHDTESGQCCYGLGANAAAVRCIHTLPDMLVAAGDDGKAIVFNM